MPAASAAATPVCCQRYQYQPPATTIARRRLSIAIRRLRIAPSIGPPNVQGCSRSRAREVVDDARLVERVREQPSWTKPRAFAVCGLYARRLAAEGLILPGESSRGMVASGWTAACWSRGGRPGIVQAWRRLMGDTSSVERRGACVARAEWRGSRRPGRRGVAR